MARGFVSYNQKEDMQDETFQIIAQLVISAIQAYRAKDAKQFHADIDSIYLLTHSRLDEDESRAFEDIIEKTGSVIYGEENSEEPDEILYSRVLDDLRAVFKDMTAALDKRGILLRMRADLERLVA